MQHLFCTKPSASALSLGVPEAQVQLCHFGHRRTVLAVIHLPARHFCWFWGAVGRPAGCLAAVLERSRWRCCQPCQEGTASVPASIALHRWETLIAVQRSGPRLATGLKRDSCQGVCACPCPQGDNRDLGPRHFCRACKTWGGLGML